MGVSSDGCLYFGFQVGEDEEPPSWLEDIEEHDFENFLCVLAGLPENSNYETRKSIIDACPAELHLYCSYDYPMYILGPKDCKFSVNRGYTEEISEDKLKVSNDKIEKFKAWCEQNNIEYKEPKWLLCSMYG